jgi:proteic killer suppression protein
MIQSFRNAATRRFYDGERVKAFEKIRQQAARKLDMLNAAVSLDDLRSPPGNRLDALKGDRAGQYSIRINEQFRLCFEWTAQGPANVEISDYH